MWWEFWLGNHSPGIKWHLHPCDSSFGNRSLFNRQNRRPRNSQWPCPEHRNLSGVEMGRKCRWGRHTSLGEATALRGTLQKACRSVVLETRPLTTRSVTRAIMRAVVGYWDPLQARPKRSWYAWAGLMPATILWEGDDCSTWYMNEDIGAQRAWVTWPRPHGLDSFALSLWTPD